MWDLFRTKSLLRPEKLVRPRVSGGSLRIYVLKLSRLRFYVQGLVQASRPKGPKRPLEHPETRFPKEPFLETEVIKYIIVRIRLK